MHSMGESYAFANRNDGTKDIQKFPDFGLAYVVSFLLTGDHRRTYMCH